MYIYIYIGLQTATGVSSKGLRVGGRVFGGVSNGVHKGVHKGLGKIESRPQTRAVEYAW
jgi:hypothetical protein